MGVLKASSSKRQWRSARGEDGHALARLAFCVLGEKDRQFFDWDNLPNEVARFVRMPGIKSIVCDEGDGDISGLVAGFVQPCFWNMSEPVAQLAIWWSTKPRVSIELMRRFEDWARFRGAKRLIAAARDERTAKLYRHMDWTHHEVNYLKEL